MADECRPQLSLVVPCFNEEDNIADLIEECFRVLKSMNIPFEMIVVDDGSTDGTLSKLREAQSTHKALRVVAMESNTGQSGALAAGFRAARGDLVATVDGDLQNDPADLPGLFERVRRGDCDVASGWRQKRNDSRLRRVSSQIANGVRKKFLGDGMNDSASAMKVYRREVLEHLPVFNGMHRFFPALAILQGFRVREIPVNHRARRHGQAKYGLWNRAFRATLDMFGVAWLRRRAVRVDAKEILPGTD